MKQNPNLCVHIWQYAFNYISSGVVRPKYNIVLFCQKCGKIKKEEIKEN